MREALLLDYSVKNRPSPKCHQQPHDRHWWRHWGERRARRRDILPNLGVQRGLLRGGGICSESSRMIMWFANQSGKGLLGRGKYTQSCFRGLVSAQLLSFPHLASTVDWVWTCAVSTGGSMWVCRNCSRPAISGLYPISFRKSSYRLIWEWLLSRPLECSLPLPLCFPSSTRLREELCYTSSFALDKRQLINNIEFVLEHHTLANAFCFLFKD